MSQIPPRQEFQSNLTSTDGEFSVQLRDGAVVPVRYSGAGPRIVMSHGNGLAIDAYHHFWRPLATKYQVVRFDFRHHGRSSFFRNAIRNWPQFIEDFGMILAEIDTQLGTAPTFGAFHSMSSLTALLHASEFTSPWTGLVAFEPPVPPHKDHPEATPFFEMHQHLAEGAARRRNAFAAVENLAGSFASRETFRRMDRSTLQDLAAATLRYDGATGQYELACDRNFEAETFRLQHLGDAWARVTSVRLPVTIVAGLSDADESHCLANVARSVASEGDFDFVTVDDATHFMQMERPDQCAAIVDSFIKNMTSKSRG